MSDARSVVSPCGTHTPVAAWACRHGGKERGSKEGEYSSTHGTDGSKPEGLALIPTLLPGCVVGGFPDLSDPWFSCLLNGERVKKNWGILST